VNRGGIKLLFWPAPIQHYVRTRVHYRVVVWNDDQCDRMYVLDVRRSVVTSAPRECERAVASIHQNAGNEKVALSIWVRPSEEVARWSSAVITR
jgi:hypothetical protein